MQNFSENKKSTEKWSCPPTALLPSPQGPSKDPVAAMGQAQMPSVRGAGMLSDFEHETLSSEPGPAGNTSALLSSFQRTKLEATHLTHNAQGLGKSGLGAADLQAASAPISLCCLVPNSGRETGDNTASAPRAHGDPEERELQRQGCTQDSSCLWGKSL